MLTIKIPRKAFVLLALLLSAVAASAVIAAWVTNGTGPGYAKAQTSSNLTLERRLGVNDRRSLPGSNRFGEAEGHEPEPVPGADHLGREAGLGDHL